MSYSLPLAPTVSVHIGDSGATPTAGQNYQLTCSVTGAENLNSAITYRWTKDSGSGQTQVGTNSSILSFTPLRLSDAASYVYGVTVSSSYLVSDITATNTLNVTIQCELNINAIQTIIVTFFKFCIKSPLHLPSH